MLALFICAKVSAQTCSGPGQVPGSEFPVCGATVFSQTVVPDCSGNVVPTPCTATTGIVFADKNPYWYKFTCFAAGTLGFLITPNNLADDYDWQLFDVTGHASADVYTDTSLFVSCNWSGEVGLTGASAAGTSSINCAGVGIPRFNAMPFLLKNHNYLLMVSHFDDGTQSGYTLEFFGGSANITDTTASRIVSAAASCSGNTVGVKLNKKLKCGSLAADGSDFSLSGTSVQIVQASASNCITGFDMDSIVLTLNSSLPPGTYSVSSKIGTDTNTLLDYCNNQMVVGRSAPFTVSSISAAQVDSLLPVGCRPNEITVLLNKPVLCSSIAPNGSDFDITGSAAVNIVSAVVSCSGLATSVIKLQLSAPIKKGGIYQLSVKQGSDGNTLENLCLVPTPVGNSKSFTTYDTVDAGFSYVINRSCQHDTIHLFGNANAIPTLWNWIIDNNIKSVRQDTSLIFSSGGIHTVRLFVKNGVCIDSLIKKLTITPLPPLSITVSKTWASCGNQNGAATVTALGGSGRVTYLWTPGNFVTASIANLSVGMYKVIATDSLGCSKKDSVFIDSFPAPRVASVVVSNVKCYGAKNGQITVNLKGGAIPIFFQWKNGAATFTGNPLRNLDTGKYSLKVTDGNGCTTTASAFISQPFPLSHLVKTTDALCVNANGSASITVAGGTPAYTYKWQPSGDTTPVITGLAAGNYIVKVIDRNGCIDTAHVLIKTPPGLTGFIVIQANSCQSAATGSATVASDGIAPFKYAWSPGGGTTAKDSGLATGNYIATITDSRGCFDTVHVRIGKNIPISATGNVKNVSCHNGADGSVSFATSGAAPFSFAWLPNVSATATANGLRTGTYAATITDSFGCQVTKTVKVKEPTVLKVKVLSYNTTCGLSNGSADAITTGGTPPYAFDWSTGQHADSIVNLSPGNLSLTVTDSNGCTISNNAIRIASSFPLKATLGADIDLCPGDTISISPGSYTAYKWQDGSALPAYVAKHAGLYSVLVTNADGCTATALLTVYPVCQDVLFPGAFTPNNDGHNDGFGPLGTLHSIQDYALHIYDRWGKTIFATANPFDKWDGKINSSTAPPGTYVWIATFTFNGKPGRIKKGTIVLMR